MPGNFWKQFGDTYDQVNSNLGGLPDAIKGFVQKAGPTALAGISSFDQAMSQSLPGVIGGAVGSKIAGAIQPGAEQNIQSAIQGTEGLRQEHPVASLIGQGGALASQMLTSPVVPAAAAGSAAARLAPTIGRNLLNAAGTTIPGTIAQGAQTGDWGTAIAQGAKDTALGGILGATGEKVLGALPAIANAAKKTLMGQAIRGGMDIDTKALRKVATYGPIGKYAGAVIDRADDLKQQLVDLMVDNPSVKTETGRRAVVAAMDDKWSQVDKAFDAYSPPAGMGKVRSFQDEIMNHPLVQDVLTANPDRLSDLDSMISKADTGKDLAATRHILQKDYINPSFAPGSKTDDEQVADLARGIHDVVDDHFVPDNLKASYARDKVIKEALSREDLKLPQATQAGSPTFARLAANAAMGGFGGEGAGLLAGQDPGQALQTAAMSAGAGLVGGIGGRVGSRLMNKGMAGGQARLAQLLGQIPQGTLEGAEQIAPRIAQAAARAPQMAQTNAALQHPDIEQGGPQGPATSAPMPAQTTPVDITQQLPGAASLGAMDTTRTQPEPAKVAPEHAQAVQQATQKEAQLTPVQIQNARDAVLAPYKEQVTKALYAKWDSWQNPYKMDWDKFLEDAQQRSSNFDPKNPYTAKFIAGDDYKRYLKSYNVALNLQDVGKDLSAAISPFSGRMFSPELGQKRNILVKTLYTAMTGDLKDPDATTKKSIENTLNNLGWQGGNKRKKLEQMLQDQYGVNFDQLRQYGLYK